MISIKGVRNGLVVICDEEPWHSQLSELQQKLDSNARFFRGGRIALDVKTLDLSPEDILRAQSLFRQYDVQLWAVLTQNQATSTRVEMLNMANSLQTEPEDESGASASSHSSTQTPGEPAMSAANDETEAHAASSVTTEGILVRKRVRSGQVLKHPGHIAVVGDVNPGAQIIAGGDIIVWGKLQGLAHAGAFGDTSAVICALDLKPSLIRIADAARSVFPAPQRERARRPEMAVLEQEEITIVPWQDR